MHLSILFQFCFYRFYLYVICLGLVWFILTWFCLFLYAYCLYWTVVIYVLCSKVCQNDPNISWMLMHGWKWLLLTALYNYVYVDKHFSCFPFQIGENRVLLKEVSVCLSIVLSDSYHLTLIFSLSWEVLIEWLVKITCFQIKIK